MKCKICGKRCNTIKAMSAHYRKKHPNRMKARKSKKPKAQNAPRQSRSYSFCPHCGGKL